MTDRSGYSRIKIQNNEIYVDDSKISGVRSINLFLSAESIPIADVEIELDSTANFEGIACTGLRFTPDTVSDAAKCLQFAMKLDPELRQAMIASAKSAMSEYSKNTEFSSTKLAEAIIDRIFDAEEIGNDDI